MREIKFREWETERKTMVIGEREDYDDSVGFRFAHEEAGQRILMQYTGLKDSHGNEIYEGDIVRGKYDSHYHSGYDKAKGEVRFHEKKLSFEVVDACLLWELEEIEVIGNKYENPELLKEERS